MRLYRIRAFNTILTIPENSSYQSFCQNSVNNLTHSNSTCLTQHYLKITEPQSRSREVSQRATWAESEKILLRLRKSCLLRSEGVALKKNCVNHAGI